MKRKITLSIALALSIVLALLTSSDRMAQAQGNRFFAYDPGIIKVGAGQLLRVTVNVGAGNDAVIIRFRQMEYTQDACSGGVCKLVVSSQSTSAPMTLMPGEAASIVTDNVDPDEFRRVVVESNRRDLRVNASIIDAATGNTTAIIAILIAD